VSLDDQQRNRTVCITGCLSLFVSHPGSKTYCWHHLELFFYLKFLLRACVRSSVCVRVCVCVCACMYVRLGMCAYVCVYVCACVLVCVSVCLCACVRAWVFVRACVCVCVYVCGAECGYGRGCYHVRGGSQDVVLRNSVIVYISSCSGKVILSVVYLPAVEFHKFSSIVHSVDQKYF